MWWIAAIAIVGPTATGKGTTLRIEQSTVGQVGSFSVGLVSVSVHKDTDGDFITAKLSIFKAGSDDAKTRLTVKGAKFDIGDIPVQVKEVVPAQNKDIRGYIVLELQPTPK